MAYTQVDKSGSHFKAKIWDGNSSTQAITGIGFQPDFVWGKQRSGTQNNQLQDAIRGANNILISNSTAAATSDTDIINSFDSDGFTLGYQDQLNDTGATYVGWNWKANGVGSANSDGTITTTYTSANTASGFSIIKYTGTGANATIGHGLGTAPNFFIIKRTDTSGFNWFCYHDDPVYMGAGKFILLDSTTAAQSSTSIWQNTAPTSSVINLGSDGGVNASGGEYICYAFSNRSGHLKVGRYTGHTVGNADRYPFLNCGFKPSFLLVRSSSLALNWTIWDDARGIINPNWNYIYPNLNQAGTNLGYGVAGSYAMDFVSNGVKIMNTDSKFNQGGQYYMYLAIGQTLVGSNNIPCTAR
jgi:hypothetical protein